MFQKGDVIDDRYRIVSTLGKGGMGTVFKAEQLDVHRTVAIKVMHESQLNDDDAEKRFFRECKLLSKLSHINIMSLYGITLNSEGTPLAISEYLNGATLREELSKCAMPWQRAVRVAVQVCDAMKYAHENGVLHRDLKPENIMLLPVPEPDHVKVMDFGLSKLIDVSNSQKLTKTGLLMGSPHYMSPEQGLGKADQRSDIYALACILFEMLSGEKLFDADTGIGIMYLQANASCTEKLKQLKTVPAGLQACLQHALEKDPEKRYQSMEDFGLALTDCVTSGQNHRNRKILNLPGIAIMVVLAVLIIALFKYAQTGAEYGRKGFASSIRKKDDLKDLKGATPLTLCRMADRFAAAKDGVDAIESYNKAIDWFEHNDLRKAGIERHLVHLKLAEFLSKDKTKKHQAVEQILLAANFNSSISESLGFIIEGLQFGPDEADIETLQNAALARLAEKNAYLSGNGSLTFTGDFTDLLRSLFASKRFESLQNLADGELGTVINAEDQWAATILSDYSKYFMHKDKQKVSLNETNRLLTLINKKDRGAFGDLYVVQHYLDAIHAVATLVEFNELDTAVKQFKLLKEQLGVAERMHILSEQQVDDIREQMKLYEPLAADAGKKRRVSPFMGRI